MEADVETLPALSDDVLEKIAAIYPFSTGVESSVENLKRELIRKMPKTDLHVHGEAGFSVNIGLMRKIAERNQIGFPEELVENIDGVEKWKYRGQKDFMQFILDFLAVSSLIRTPQDIEDLCYAFYESCYHNNVIFTLPGISWVQCKERMSMDEFYAAYNRALERGARDFGHVTVMRFRYYLERHLSPTDFDVVLSEFLKTSNPFVTTVGLAGDENQHPLSDFEAVYRKLEMDRKVSRHPWYFLTSHMEAHTNPRIIEDATALLDWVGHGWYVVDDPQILARIRERGIQFEVCPLSDTHCFSKRVATVAEHQPLLTLMEWGLATLNSDDPAFFGDINEVYWQVFHQLKVSFSQLLKCSSRGLNPVSPKTLAEMKEHRPDKHAEHLKLVEVGKLKIEFFKAYWELLPLMAKAKLEPDLAQRFLALDLKTRVGDLAPLGYAIPDGYEELQQKFSVLMEKKESLDLLITEINKDISTLTNSSRVERVM